MQNTISVFPIDLKTIGEPQKWPKLRSLESKFRETPFVGTYALRQSPKFHIDQYKTVAMARA